MTGKHLCVAIYLTHTQADEALSRLQFSGYTTDHLSLAGRDTWSNAAGSYATGDGSLYCGGLGAFWEKIWGLLLGQGVFCTDKDGPLLIAGPLVQTMVSVQPQDPADGSSFERGLSALGIPQDSIVQYAKAVLNDQILLFVSGNLEEVNRSRDILNETKAINHTLHHGAGDHLFLEITENEDRPSEGD